MNPYLRETVKFKCMALLAVDRQPATTKKLEETVRVGGYLFPKDDPLAWEGQENPGAASRSVIEQWQVYRRSSRNPNE